MKGFLDYARSRGAILYYDVNFRPSHRNDVMKLTPSLLENLEMADIVRGSSEDFGVIYGKSDPDVLYNAEISFYCKQFILTQGPAPVALRTRTLKKDYPISATGTVCTIGAGDNFNAGLVYGLLRYDITREDLYHGMTEDLWDRVVSCAQRFSANCCQSINNSVSPEFGQEMKEQMEQEMRLREAE